jgi:hypothetical protein
MVSWDFSLPRSEKEFQNAQRLSLALTVVLFGLELLL